MRRQSIVALLVSAAAAGLSGQVSLAQDSPQDDSGLALEEIVVTARKREESLIDVPVAVTAISAEQIENRQINSIDDLARFSPGLVFSNSFGRSNERPVMRGMASVLAGTNPTVETGVSYFVDGVYYPGDIQSLDMSEVARTEVIRGPQSALYGRNTYAGAINFITKGIPDEFEATVKGNYDNAENRASLQLSAPLGDMAGVRLSLRNYDFSGQHVNQLTGRKVGQERSKTANLAITIEPSDNVEIRLRGVYNEDRDGSRPLFLQSAEFNNCYPGTRSLDSYNSTSSTNRNQYFCGEIGPRPIYLNDAPVTQPITLLAGIPATLVGTGATGGVYDTRVGPVFSGVNRDLTFVTGLVSWEIGGSGYNLIVDGGYRSEYLKTGSDSDHSSVNTIPALAAVSGIAAPAGVRAMATGSASDIARVDDFSAEIKLESPQDRRFRWMLGAYHYNQERKVYAVDFGSPEGQSAPNDIYDTIGNSLFGSVQFDFTDKFKGSAELRRSKDNKGLYNFQPRAGFGSPGPLTFAGNSGGTVNRAVLAGGIPGPFTAGPTGGEWTDTTPRVSLSYKFSPQMNLYVTYAEGSKPGGYNGGLAIANGLPANVTFEPETSKNLELGLKSTFFDRRLSLDVAVFMTDVEDMQLTTPIQNSAGALSSISTNQGSGETRGLEVEARFQATEYLTTSFTYALADTEFTEGCDDFQWTLTSGGGIYLPSGVSNNPNGRGDCSIVGNPFPLSAKNTASLAADYKRPIMDGAANFYINGSVSFTDKKPVQVHDNPYTPAATIVDARVGWETDTWSVGFYGRNLTNEDAPPGATRWFHNLVGIAGVTLDTGLPPANVTCPSAAPGCAANPTFVGSLPQLSYTLPRAFFGNLRRERQIGIEGSYKFGANKEAPPVKVVDSDGDGVTDDIDRCPGTPAGTAVDASGCPLPKDTDGDGVMDPNDKCPNTPAGARVDANGCELDADGDGVVDRLDQCANTPAGAKVDANGCELDSDGDGVVDSKDQCPDTPKGDRVDSYGCTFKTELKLPGVVFETNSAELKAESIPVLDGAVATLKRYPELVVEVAGHTDSDASDAYNLNLSKRRAETVMKYLTDNGATNSLKARGYGERQPVASNKTAEGKAQNRRVVLRILEK